LNKDDSRFQVSRKWRFREGLTRQKAIRTRLKGQQDARPFHYFDKGDMARYRPCGSDREYFRLPCFWLASMAYLAFIHLMYIVEFQSRVLVFVQWGFEYLTFSRGARLITGDTPTDVTGPPKSS